MILTAPSKRIQGVLHSPAWALVAAFGTYFCMYGFRKPYTAATYSPAFFWGFDYKILLVLAQTLGYVAAKWLGIKIVSEIKPNQRIKLLSALILVAELMLLFFGLIPPPWSIFCLLLNGLSLGIIFGLVLGFLEGRKNSEMLIAGLCASFIVADGVTKSVGKWLLDLGMMENWMPFMAGLVFLVPTVIFISMLAFVPPPSQTDVECRSVRVPMLASARWEFFIKYAPGLVAIVLIYLLVTLLRSVRADFAPEIWKGLGYPQTPALFTQSELLVSFAVTVINGLVIFILNHYRAFRFSLVTCFSGFILILAAVWGLRMGLGDFPFMVLVGFGLYTPYVAIHTTIFERLIAITKEKANIGFLMYLADAAGYTGYIILMLLRFLTPPGESIFFLFIRLCIYLGCAGGLIVLFCSWYFKWKFKNNEQYHTPFSTGQSGAV
ncbi:MAG TPA: DUF5690 family protein [Puia sp.]|nr:DUF5690 family protein [Puia sp.]